MRILFWSISLFGMWLVLTSNLQIANVIIGLGVSFSISILYSIMFTHNKFEFINPIWLFVYIIVLIKNLIISNLQIAKKTLSKDMKLAPAILEIETNLTSEWKKLLLANSITLTPGTLTLDIKGNMLYIHVIECKDVNNKQNIIKEFEEIISKL